MNGGRGSSIVPPFRVPGDPSCRISVSAARFGRRNRVPVLGRRATGLREHLWGVRCQRKRFRLGDVSSRSFDPSDLLYQFPLGSRSEGGPCIF
jgi:hypothetical protein